MTNLPNAPLVYTIGVVHFPAVPDAKRFVPAFHDAIRDRYPNSAFVNLAQANLQFGPQGIQVLQQEAPMWQFSNPDRSWAFILAPQLLVLHTIAYVDHKDFVATLRFGLERLLAVPGIKLTYIEAMGIRYVDSVKVRPGERLDQYLKPTVLPPTFDELPGLQVAEGIYVSRFTTDVGELRFQVLRNPATVLPPELETPLIQQNGWTMKRPDGDFAVVDIDNGTRFDPLKPMDVQAVCDHMLELRRVAKAMFESIGTEHAMRVWNGDA